MSEDLRTILKPQTASALWSGGQTRGKLTVNAEVNAGGVRDITIEKRSDGTPPDSEIEPKEPAKFSVVGTADKGGPVRNHSVKNEFSMPFRPEKIVMVFPGGQINVPYRLLVEEGA